MSDAVFEKIESPPVQPLERTAPPPLRGGATAGNGLSSRESSARSGRDVSNREAVKRAIDDLRVHYPEQAVKLRVSAHDAAEQVKQKGVNAAGNVLTSPRLLSLMHLNLEQGRWVDPVRKILGNIFRLFH